MRIMSIEKVEPGMKVGRSIYGANGKTLLANGVKLTSRYIERIKELGIVVMYIFDESVGDIQGQSKQGESARNRENFG